MTILLAKDIMSAPVISIRDDEIITNFITTLLDKGINGVAVTNKKGDLKGILTKTDLITFELERLLNNLYTTELRDIIDEVCDPVSSGKAPVNKKPNDRTILVKDMMIHNVYTATENTSIKDICLMMKTEKIRHVIITNNDKVTGIITATDIIKLVSQAKAELNKEDYV